MYKLLALHILHDVKLFMYFASPSFGTHSYSWEIHGSDSKTSPYSVRDLGSIPRLGRSPGEGKGNPFQYYCLENSMDGEAWWANEVHAVSKSQTRLSDFIFFLLPS